MSKGVLGLLKQSTKDKEKEKRKEFIKRRDLFFAEYRLLANKYKCDWNPYMRIDEFGQKATPHLEIIDATSFLEKEDEDKKESNES